MSDPSAPAQRRGKRGICLQNLNWTVVIGLLIMHVGALAAPWFFDWTSLVVMVVLIWISAGLGITLGYHRLLTHRSFKTARWFEYFVTACGCLTWQGSPVQWVGIHRIHHAHSDEDDDPHTPHHGFTWAHMLWCMHNETEGMKGVDAAKDLMRDPVHRLMHRWFLVPQFFLAAALYWLGEWAASAGWSASGLSWVIWGVFVRTTIVYHATWFVNSASHTWGYRNYQTTDSSTNLWWVALLSFGEGWHNNHHAHQRAAAHGRRWFELDPTYWTIKLLQVVGLARDIVKHQPLHEDRHIMPHLRGERS
jgi:stearoyl-CoA desaturase (delta-9 desaturase)